MRTLSPSAYDLEITSQDILLDRFSQIYSTWEIQQSWLNDVESSLARVAMYSRRRPLREVHVDIIFEKERNGVPGIDKEVFPRLVHTTQTGIVVALRDYKMIYSRNRRYIILIIFDHLPVPNTVNRVAGHNFV